MKKWIALLLLFVLLLPLCSATAESVIINKITDPDNDFEFPEDAKLLEVYWPKIYDCAAVYLQYGEYNMLLDCGGELWKETEKLLNKLGVTELTYALNSHPHSDHIGGFQHVLKKIPAGEFLLCFDEDDKRSNDLAFKVYDQLHAIDIPFRRLKHDDTIEFGDVKMTILQRTDPFLTGNNASAMLRVELGERSFLFAADVQADAQLLFVDANAPLKADILQHPHHGYNIMQYPFLNAVDPELVIVTSMSAFANGVKQLKSTDTDYHYTNLGIMRMTTDGNVWVVERIK